MISIVKFTIFNLHIVNTITIYFIRNVCINNIILYSFIYYTGIKILKYQKYQLQKPNIFIILSKMIIFLLKNFICQIVFLI